MTLVGNVEALATRLAAEFAAVRDELAAAGQGDPGPKGDTGPAGTRGLSIHTGNGAFDKTKTPAVVLTPQYLPGDLWLDRDSATLDLYLITAADLA